MSYERVVGDDDRVSEGVPTVGPATEFCLVVPPNPTLAEFEQTIANRRVEFNISKYVHEGWSFTKYNLCQFLGISLIFVLVTVGLLVAFAYLFFGGIVLDWNQFQDGETDGVRFQMDWDARTIMIAMAFTVGSYLFFYMPAFASLYKAVFNAMRTNSRVRFADFFSCFNCPYWCRLMALVLVLFIGREVGFWLFFVPGVYFSMATVFSIPMHVEQSFSGVINSVVFSFRIFNRYFCSMLAFLILLGLLQIVGVLCLGVGLFVTVPVAFTSLCYCYHHLVGVNGVAVMVPVSQLEIPQMVVSQPAPSDAV